MRRSARVALLVSCSASALLCSACALRPQPVELRPHLTAPRPTHPEGRARLAVGRFADARSRLDRGGVQPPLELRWFGLARQGANRTGDATFIGEVAEGARLDAAATLAASGAFSEVTLVDAGDAEGERGDLPAGYDRLLVATVESLAGTQEQDSVLSIAVIGWLRSRFDPPEGRASLHYRLYDREGLAWETTVDTVHTSPRRTIAESALDALSRSNERFAEQLYEREVPLAERRRRRVAVRVLDACGAGAVRTARLGQDVSRVFERTSGTTLEMEHVAWRPQQRGDLAATLREVQRVRPPTGGIVVAFVPMADDPGPRSDSRFGLARPLGSHAVVGCLPRGEIRVLTIVHEVAHLYGALHVGDRSSIMYPVLEFDARFFDPLNQRILRASADRPFGEPLPQPMAQHLLAIYRAAETLGDWVDEGELAKARRAVELQDARSARPGS